jgi:hypothetical protein
MKTSSLERKDPEVFWLRVRLLVKVVDWLIDW